MTPHDLIAAFDSVAEAPDGVERLRELMLQLAVRGRLVPQDTADEPARVLLERIEAEEVRLVRAGKIAKQEPLPPVSQDDMPFVVAEGWCWARFTDVARIASNLVDPAEFRSEPHVAPDDIEKATGRLLGYRTIGEAGVTSSKHRFSPGQILYSKIRPNLSKVVIVDFAGLCSADMYPIDPWIDRGYLHKVMLSRLFVDQVTSDDNRLAMPKVNKEQLSGIRIPVPPLPEQHRIVARVDELMSLLAGLESARTTRDATRAASRDSVLDALRAADTTDEIQIAWNRLAERMDDLLCEPGDIAPLRQTVLQLAVRGRLVPQDPTDEPASVLLGRIAAEKTRLVTAGKIATEKQVRPVSAEDAPFDIPTGWTWCHFGDLLVEGPTNGWSPTAVEYDTGVRTLKLSATTSGVFDGRHFKFVEAELQPESSLWLKPGDLLIQRSNTPEYVGMAAVYHGGPQAFIYPDLMMRCRLSSMTSVKFVHAALISPTSRQWFSERASGTSQSMVKINQGTVRATLVSLPPLAEQHRIVAKVDELMGLLDRLEERLAAARNTHTAFAAAAVHHLDT